MKYCVKCGKELLDEAVFCTGCGCATGTPMPTATASQTTSAAPATEKQESTMQLLAKIFMIIGTVAMGWLIIPLAWCLPLTISYWNKVKTKQPVSTGFKVCSLLFVSMLAGIFMLCDNEQN